MTSHSRRARILVVDDEPMITSAVRRTLAGEHDVTTLTSATAARDLIAGGERFDVILCDLMMPEMTGMELYRAVAELAPEQAKAMIFLTGGAFTQSARAFLDHTTNLHLEKPFESAALRALIHQRLAP